MNTAKLLSCSAILALGSLAATPAFALYTGIAVTGTAQEISSVTINLDGGGTYTAQKTATGLGVDIPVPIDATTQGTATTTTADGQTHTGPISVHSDGTIGTDVSGDSCLPGICGWASADYAYYSPSSGTKGSEYGLTLGGYMPLGNGISAEADFGYHSISTSTSSSNWALGGDLLWGRSNVRIGANLGFQSNSSSGFSQNTLNYGLFAQYFPSRIFTLDANGGGYNTSTNFSSSDFNGYYLGGGVTGYFTRDFGLNASIEHTQFDGKFSQSHEDDFTIGFRWLPREESAIALKAGYTYASFQPGNFSANIFYVNLIVFCDNNGALSLIDRDRTAMSGILPWASAAEFKF